MHSHCSVSSLTSISSRTSVEIYNGDLKPVISDILQSDEDLLPNLVNKAEEMLKMFSADQLNIFTSCRKGDEKATVNLHAIMSAMLTCVEECGEGKTLRRVGNRVLWPQGRQQHDRTTRRSWNHLANAFSVYL